jgi:hypothetical protein
MENVNWEVRNAVTKAIHQEASDQLTECESLEEAFALADQITSASDDVTYDGQDFWER